MVVVLPVTGMRSSQLLSLPPAPRQIVPSGLRLRTHLPFESLLASLFPVSSLQYPRPCPPEQTHREWFHHRDHPMLVLALLLPSVGCSSPPRNDAMFQESRRGVPEWGPESRQETGVPCVLTGWRSVMPAFEGWRAGDAGRQHMLHAKKCRQRKERISDPSKVIIESECTSTRYQSHLK